MYRLLQRGGLNWGRSNFIPGFPLHLPRPLLSFPGPYALRKKIILITFGTDHVQWRLSDAFSSKYQYYGKQLIIQNKDEQNYNKTITDKM